MLVLACGSSSPVLDRAEAIAILKRLGGADLRLFAQLFDVTTGRNKGWAGLVVERFLGITPNCRQGRDTLQYELKTVEIREYRDGTLRAKEEMRITKINREHVVRTPFTRSHLFDKLSSLIVVAHIDGVLARVQDFDLRVGSPVYRQVRADYEVVRDVLRTESVEGLSGKLGKLIKPKTQGSGHGSTTRSFYARKSFVDDILKSRDGEEVLQPFMGD